LVLLKEMQNLLARLYDAPVEQDVRDFLFTDRRHAQALLASEDHTDEQVFVVEENGGVRIGVFIDSTVLDRLAARDPLRELSDANLADFCTVLEGVSHFHYLMWSIGRGRGVSLLELELQAEVDKYASAVALMVAQRDGYFPHALHMRLFHRIAFAPHLDSESRHRYEEANRHAARYCRALDERYLRTRRTRPEQWLGELRKFFRAGWQEKMRVSG
jgi:hypothetical protein